MILLRILKVQIFSCEDILLDLVAGCCTALTDDIWAGISIVPSAARGGPACHAELCLCDVRVSPRDTADISPAQNNGDRDSMNILQPDRPALTA